MTTHGYALNVDLDPAPFTRVDHGLRARGRAVHVDERASSTARVTVAEVRPVAASALAEVFGLELEPLPAEDGAGLWRPTGARAPRRCADDRPATGTAAVHSHRVRCRPPCPSRSAAPPEWMKVRAPSATAATSTSGSSIHGASLHTVCEEARCPNIGECWGRGTATFQILGETCTRACRYCYVQLGQARACPRPARAAPARAGGGDRWASSTWS